MSEERNKGVDLRMAQEFLGHAGIATTQRHARLGGASRAGVSRTPSFVAVLDLSPIDRRTNVTNVRPD